MDARAPCHLGVAISTQHKYGTQRAHLFSPAADDAARLITVFKFAMKGLAVNMISFSTYFLVIVGFHGTFEKSF